MNDKTVSELKFLAKSKGLRRYSRLRKAELISFLQQNPENILDSSVPPPTTRLLKPISYRARPVPPPHPSRGLRKKLNRWYNWLVNHTPTTVRKPVSQALTHFEAKSTIYTKLS